MNLMNVCPKKQYRSVFASLPLTVDISATAVTQVWTCVGELIFGGFYVLKTNICKYFVQSGCAMKTHRGLPL